MRLTPEELAQLTEHLVSVLKRKRFTVKVNRFGLINYAEKHGIKCYPAILNSLEDGRQGYAYIQNIVSSYSERDLGSYYKPRTNKDKHILFKHNDSIDKYSGTDVHIDTHNYKQVIETFANDLNKDYNRIVSHRGVTEDVDLDVDDSGTCKWSALLEGWIISENNAQLKQNILDTMKEVLSRGDVDNLSDFTPGVTMERIQQVEDSQTYLLGCQWIVTPFKRFGSQMLQIKARDNGGIHELFGNLSVGISEIMGCIDEWIKTHQERVESLSESLVKIKNTNSVFDGKTGEVESENENKVVVMVNFDDVHKVRNTFTKDQIEVLEESNMILKEDDNELEPLEGNELEVVEFDDEAAFALTQFLENEENTPALIERAYPGESSGYNSHVYVNREDNTEWLVCTYDEARDYAYEDIESLIDDIGAIEAFGYSLVSYFLSDSHFDEMMEEDIRYLVDDMSEEELIEELESYDLIDEDDMIPDEDWEPDEEDGETEEDRPMIYPERLIEDKKEELIEKRMNEYSSGIDWFENTFGEREMEEYIKNNPDCIDIDGLIQNILDSDGFGNTLNRYDGSEEELEYEGEDGEIHTLYAYRIN